MGARFGGGGRASGHRCVLFGSGLEEALSEAANWARTTTGSRWFCILASAQAYEKAIGGRLAELLVRLVRDGPTSDRLRYLWENPYDTGVRGATLIAAITDEWPYGGQRPLPATFGGANVVFLPNRRYDPAAPERLVEAEDSAWFTGRQRLIGEIVAWLGAGRPGVRVLTGAPGSGKSAVLDRLAGLLDPVRRVDPAQESDLGSVDLGAGEAKIDAVVRARGLGADGLLEKLSAVLGVPRPESVWDLLAWLAERETRAVLFVDALDEAIGPERGRIATEVLARLAEVALVLVATRDIPADAEGKRPLDALSSVAAPWNLDHDEDTEADLIAYVTRRLASSANRELTTIAMAVAQRAMHEDAGFLYARVVTDLLRQDPIDTTLPGGEEALKLSVSAAFARTLDQAPAGLTPADVRNLLTPLACSFGSGLPASDVWLHLSNTLSRDHRYSLTDVGAVLGSHGRFVVEAGEDGQAVYRLFHRELADHLTQADSYIIERIDDNIGRLWLEQTGEGRVPDRADPYLRRYGPLHLTRRGEEGITVLRRLAETNPASYLPHLAGSLTELSYVRRGMGQGEGAARAAEEATGICRRLAEADPDTFLPGLAGSLTTLANALVILGLREDAAQTAEEATSIYRRLAEARADAFQSGLAISLGNFSVALGSLGQWEDAAEVAHEATSTYRRLAEAHPNAFQPNLAWSLTILASALGSLGRREDAAQAAEEAAGIYRPLAAASPDAFLPGLAGSLANLASALGSLGRREDAAQAAEEATSIYRRLAAVGPDAFLPGLAAALINSASALGAVGRREDAAQAAEEAAGIYRPLAAASPDAYLPGLALSLTNLADVLGGVGRREDAAQAAEEAAGIYRPLAAASPDAYLPGLALSLTNLADVLGGVGRREDAAQAAEEAASIYRRLAAASPDASLPGLATSLSSLSNFQRELGQRQDARQAAEEATGIYRRLAAASPDAFLPSLAAALINSANALGGVGRREDAAQAAEEAAGIYRRLAAASPDAFLPGLAGSLANLSGMRRELGQWEGRMPGS